MIDFFKVEEFFVTSVGTPFTTTLFLASGLVGFWQTYFEFLAQTNLHFAFTSENSYVSWGVSDC